MRRRIYLRTNPNILLRSRRPCETFLRHPTHMPHHMKSLVISFARWRWRSESADIELLLPCCSHAQSGPPGQCADECHSVIPCPCPRHKHTGLHVSHPASDPTTMTSSCEHLVGVDIVHPITSAISFYLSPVLFSHLPRNNPSHATKGHKGLTHTRIIPRTHKPPESGFRALSPLPCAYCPMYHISCSHTR